MFVVVNMFAFVFVFELVFTFAFALGFLSLRLRLFCVFVSFHCLHVVVSYTLVAKCHLMWKPLDGS